MNRAIRTTTPSRTIDRRGLVSGVAAYAAWGVLPVYFKQLSALPSWSIVAHRIAWSVPFLLVLLWATGRMDRLRAVLADKRTLGWLAITATLIAVNWLIYAYAVISGHILAGSLGYYLNPLANVLLGRIVLKEQMTRVQWLAIAIAAAGIIPLAAGALGQLWISLVLCVSFASYGLLRKLAPVDASTGLAIETLLLLPVAGGWLLLVDAPRGIAFGPGESLIWLLLLSGIVTSVPMLLFTIAARRIAYSTLGMLQFLAPSLQLGIAVLVYGEPFSVTHAIAFAAIWIALILYVTAILRTPRLPTPPE
jgi:chloramphenicol-sensitive protein RarD